MTSVEESRLKVWAELGPQTGSPQPRRDLGSRGRHAAEHCREAVIMSGMAPPWTEEARAARRGNRARGNQNAWVGGWGWVGRGWGSVKATVPQSNFLLHPLQVDG